MKSTDLVLSSDLENVYEWFIRHDLDEPYDKTLEGFLGWFGDQHCLYEHETGLDKTTFKQSLCSEVLKLTLERLEELYQELHDLWDIYGSNFALP